MVGIAGYSQKIIYVDHAYENGWKFMGYYKIFSDMQVIQIDNKVSFYITDEELIYDIKKKFIKKELLCDDSVGYSGW